MENSIKNQLEESRKDGTLKETLQGMGFNRLQSVEIAKGLNNEVDITKYADKKYDAAQMKSIRLALEEGMDITPLQITVIIICRWRKLKRLSGNIWI